MIYIGYCYQSVNGLSLSLYQRHYIKRLSLYVEVTNREKKGFEIIWKPLNKQILLSK